MMKTDRTIKWTWVQSDKQHTLQQSILLWMDWLSVRNECHKTWWHLYMKTNKKESAIPLVNQTDKGGFLHPAQRGWTRQHSTGPLTVTNTQQRRDGISVSGTRTTDNARHGGCSRQAYPVAPLARDARGTRDAGLALSSGRKTSYDPLISPGTTHTLLYTQTTVVSTDLPSTQESPGNLLLPTEAEVARRTQKEENSHEGCISSC